MKNIKFAIFILVLFLNKLYCQDNNNIQKTLQTLNIDSIFIRFSYEIDSVNYYIKVNEEVTLYNDSMKIQTIQTKVDNKGRMISSIENPLIAYSIIKETDSLNLINSYIDYFFVKKNSYLIGDEEWVSFTDEEDKIIVIIYSQGNVKVESIDLIKYDVYTTAFLDFINLIKKFGNAPCK